MSARGMASSTSTWKSGGRSTSAVSCVNLSVVCTSSFKASSERRVPASCTKYLKEQLRIKELRKRKYWYKRPYIFYYRDIHALIVTMPL